MDSVPDDRIRIVPYDPAWPLRFEEERARLAELLGDAAPGGIHHVGSTSVPGLAAKPVIDILAGVEDLERSRPLIDPLGRLGYVYAPHRADEMHWLCKPGPGRRTHHLHLVPTGSKRFRDELAFRDLLRADAALAADYVALKRRLAERFAHDREAYTDGKADFVAAALRDAAG